MAFFLLHSSWKDQASLLYNLWRFNSVPHGRKKPPLVPAYYVSVCKCGGAPCTHSTFIEMAPRPRHTAGPTETPPPHTQADLGVGGHVRERELGVRDHVTCYVIGPPCHVTISGRRGGDPPHHRSHDTSVIGGDMHALDLLLPYAGEGK